MGEESFWYSGYVCLIATLNHLCGEKDIVCKYIQLSGQASVRVSDCLVETYYCLGKESHMAP
jgi:hypothetical protein